MVDADSPAMVAGSDSSTDKVEKEDASSSESLHERDDEGWSMVDVGGEERWRGEKGLVYSGRSPKQWQLDNHLIYLYLYLYW